MRIQEGWKWGLIFYALVEVIDLGSSFIMSMMGYQEGNPLMQNAYGGFSLWKALVIKSVFWTLHGIAAVFIYRTIKDYSMKLAGATAGLFLIYFSMDTWLKADSNNILLFILHWLTRANVW